RRKAAAQFCFRSSGISEYKRNLLTSAWRYCSKAYISAFVTDLIEAVLSPCWNPKSSRSFIASANLALLASYSAFAWASAFKRSASILCCSAPVQSHISFQDWLYYSSSESRTREARFVLLNWLLCPALGLPGRISPTDISPTVDHDHTPLVG